MVQWWDCQIQNLLEKVHLVIPRSSILGKILYISKYPWHISFSIKEYDIISQNICGIPFASTLLLSWAQMVYVTAGPFHLYITAFPITRDQLYCLLILAHPYQLQLAHTWLSSPWFLPAHISQPIMLIRAWPVCLLVHKHFDGTDDTFTVKSTVELMQHFMKVMNQMHSLRWNRHYNVLHGHWGRQESQNLTGRRWIGDWDRQI